MPASYEAPRRIARQAAYCMIAAIRNRAGRYEPRRVLISSSPRHAHCRERFPPLYFHANNQNALAGERCCIDVIEDSPSKFSTEAADSATHPLIAHGKHPAVQRASRLARATPFALCIACHTRLGVAGMSIRSMPSGPSASMIALMTTGGAPMVPDSPMPFTPIGLVLQRTSSSAISKFGSMSARGIA